MYFFTSQFLHLRKSNQVNCVKEATRVESETVGEVFGNSNMSMERDSTEMNSRSSRGRERKLPGSSPKL